MELLERQFPIDENHPSIQLRRASEFAKQLNVHVNHLNRSLKDTTLKTTSQIIAERVLQEAKVLLKHSALNVTEISDALGFKEVTHFNNFFKKHVDTSPLKFRNGMVQLRTRKLVPNEEPGNNDNLQFQYHLRWQFSI